MNMNFTLLTSLPVTYIGVMSGRRILDVDSFWHVTRFCFSECFVLSIRVPPDKRSLAVAAASAKRPHDELMRIAH